MNIQVQCPRCGALADYLAEHSLDMVKCPCCAQYILPPQRASPIVPPTAPPSPPRPRPQNAYGLFFAGLLSFIFGKGDSWKMMTVTAKSEARPHGEFVEGTLFFGVWKNHVILHQTMSCRAEQLESHLAWMADKAAGDGEASGKNILLISLDDPLPKAIRGKDTQPVKSIRIASALESKPLEKTKGATHSTAFNFTPSGGAWEGIKSILASLHIAIADDVLLNEALEPRDLRVRLELSCTKKQAQSSAGEVLGKLGHALRHAAGDFYTVQLTDGTIIKGKEIKIERAFRVDCADRLPVPDSIFKAMMEFFADLVESQTIIEQDGFGNVK